MNKKSIGFGMRGTMLILYQAIAFYLFTVFNSFAQNIQASGNEMFYGWNAARVSQIYTIVTLIDVLFQLLFARKIANAKNIKMISVIFMSLSVVFGFGIATVFVSEALWLLLFALAIFFSHVGCTLLVGVLIGQWFPRRKGTVMGIATLAFPITGGALLSVFAANYFSKGPLMAYLPFLIVGIAGIVIALIFIKDYPEQCGEYRDNDKNMDPETARAIMEQEIEAKKNSVWTVKHIFKCRDFWFMSIPMGILLATSVGAMTQIIGILNTYPDFYEKYGTIATFMVTIVACAGSYIIGILDTRFGTKKAVIISCVFAVLTGAIGIFASVPTLLIGFYLLCIFEGAASNFAVSMAAQYWRREDFPSVYGIINPIVNVVQAFGPMIITMIGLRFGFHITLGIIGISGVVALILICLVNPEHIRKMDNKYREAAGLPVDKLP